MVVRSPHAGLPAALFEQQRLGLRVHLPSDGNNASLNIDDELHHVLEAESGQARQLS